MPESIFPVTLNLIDQYQRKYPSLLAKYIMGTYQKYSFRGGSNIDLNLISCDGKIDISSILQSYVLSWYHTYILRKLMYRTKAIIRQQLY